jgi:hypothetical protein
MSALIFQEDLDLSYLWAGNLLYVWLVMGFVIVLLIVDKFFGLRRIIEAAIAIVAFWRKKSTVAEDLSLISVNFQTVKKNLDDLKTNQDILIERFASVQSVLEKMQLDLHALKPNKGSQGSTSLQNFKHKTERDLAAGDTTQGSSTYPAYTEPETRNASDMTDLYNASRTDHSSRTRFLEKYKPFFITVTNDVDRRRNANLPADFRREVDGSYLAVPRVSDEAIVFPNFTLVVVDAVYGPGALGEVFDCESFDDRFSYRNIRVAMPATFKLTGGHCWQVIKRGKLDLGPGQDD